MEKKPSDHVLAIVKAGISAVPIVGDPIASLIGDYIPTSTQRSIEQAIEDLRRQLSELEDRIDPEAVDREQFAELFKSCYLVLVRTHQAKTRKAAVRLIVGVGSVARRRVYRAQRTHADHQRSRSNFAGTEAI